MAQRYCVHGHDTDEVGRATNGQCRVCRRRQQTSLNYRLRRQERQRQDEQRAKRWRRDVSRRGFRTLGAQIAALPEKLRDLIGI